MEWYFIVLAALVGLFLLILLLVYLAMAKIFHRRYEGKRHLKYFTAEDFPGLMTEPIEFAGNHKQPLRGFIYYRGERVKIKGLIIFCHGIGAGHYAYTTEINTLASAGYQVLAFDYTGCALSGGKSIHGLTQALLDFEAAVGYVERRPDLASLKRIVFGHSWGGYVANNLFDLGLKADKLISIAGFNNVPDVICDVGHGLQLFKPFFHIVNFFEFGKYANYSSLNSLHKSEIPTLLIQSRCDQLIKYHNALARYIKATKGRGNFTYIIDEEKMHNPYLTLEAERYYNKIVSRLSYMEKKASPEEQMAFYDSIDYKLITEEDPEFMKKILDWIEE
ncbi:MAG: alpha/beta fold hydrolase [Firmicutes bacterium]|nr:alpha/beta fold hydrolase [Bacillota bacterium]